MDVWKFCFVLLACVMFIQPSHQDQSPAEAVYNHVKTNANLTFREPSGYLKYKYLVPSGPYNQLWDWDSYMMGVGMLPFGSAPYLSGSMMNFLDHTNSTNGDVQGSLTPSGATGVIFHAKPVILQGAWIAAKHLGNYDDFKPFKSKMEALLQYWERERKDHDTGLYVWYNQLETGADNLPISTCMSNFSSCWNTKLHALKVSATDVMSFLYREHVCFAKFLKKWSETDILGDEMLKDAQLHDDIAEDIKKAMNKHLWNDKFGRYVAYNTSMGSVDNRVCYMALPVWALLSSEIQATRCAEEILKSDMFSEFGIRSTSSQDPRYNNKDIIKPYSNWQGPVWVLPNALLAYGFMEYGHTDIAKEITQRIVNTLANDLKETQTWHEAYHSETGKGLAAPGFLSWDTLVGVLTPNIDKGINPFSLEIESDW